MNDSAGALASRVGSHGDADEGVGAPRGTEREYSTRLTFLG